MDSVKQGPLHDRGDKSVLPFVTKRAINNFDRTKPYLVRWSLWLPFGLSLKLHQILLPDNDRCSHDHPWWFVRIILSGGYVEQHGEDGRESIRKPWRPWAPWRIYYCPLAFRHRIVRLMGPTSWTLVLCGSRRREWGFFTLSGWVQWRNFVNAARSERVMWCDDGRTLRVDKPAAEEKARDT